MLNRNFLRTLLIIAALGTAGASMATPSGGSILCRALFGSTCHPNACSYPINELPENGEIFCHNLGAQQGPKCQYEFAGDGAGAPRCQ